VANKLYVSEFKNAVSPIGTYASQEAMPQPSVVDQIVAVGGTSTPSAAFNAATYAVLLVTDTACCIAFSHAGATPVADNTKNMLLPANVPMKFAVEPGGKVACVTP
jgi:hypothetical protein